MGSLTRHTGVRVLLKALILFVLANLLWAVLAQPGGPLPEPGSFSLYNHLFPGRARFPFGEAPREAYNFSLFDLKAMFESHEIDPDKPAGEYRVALIGDSSVWGTLLRPEETLAGQLNRAALTTPDGRRARFYNLGYPTISLTKDLMILDETVDSHRPDLVIWLTTLEAFPRDKQLAVPLVENNPTRTRQLIRRYNLNLEPAALDSSLLPPTLLDGTIVAQRKNLADLVRLQLYGVLWAATGIDQLYPADYPRAQVDLDPDPTFHGAETLTRSDLAFEVLEAGAAMLRKEGIPLLVVNEPVMISNGENSEIRYNFYYPRRAYDQYRAWMAEAADSNGYAYLDAWDLIEMERFTNSAIHIDAEGTEKLAEKVREAVEEIFTTP